MFEAYREYFAFMEQLGGVLERLTELEKNKAAAVRRDDLIAVEGFMKQEQAMSLTLRSMDRKRETLLGKLGMRDVNLSGFVPLCPEELRSEAREAVEKLRSRYALYQSAADVARTTLECNLHQIERMLSDEAGEPGGGSMADIRA